LNNKMCLH